MPEIRVQQPGGAPEVESGEIHIPDDRELGYGEYTVKLKPRSLPARKVIFAVMINPPAFQISATINPNGDVVVWLDRADGADPISRRTFRVPSDIVGSLPHRLRVIFSKWEITEASVDDVPLIAK